MFVESRFEKNFTKTKFETNFIGYTEAPRSLDGMAKLNTVLEELVLKIFNSFL